MFGWATDCRSSVAEAERTQNLIRILAMYTLATAVKMKGRNDLLTCHAGTGSRGGGRRGIALNILKMCSIRDT